MLKEKILRRESGYLFYGLTPPKSKNPEEKIRSIAQKQMDRLNQIEVDGLILYDIQDEASRTNEPRPFPYLPTLDPDFYCSEYLKSLKIPKLIYKSIGKFDEESFRTWIQDNDTEIDLSVFVGAPSRDQKTNLSLQKAYQIKEEMKSSIILGGVTIPERHEVKGDEHLRVFDKIDKGCNFFISQCVYSVNHTKNFLSDYFYHALENEREMAPIIFTITPCGSAKTLQFMKWLGIDIPKWLHRDLVNSHDILSKSVDIAKNIAEELMDYCHDKEIPIGFNIESVAIRKEEIDASIELVKDIKAMQDRVM